MDQELKKNQGITTFTIQIQFQQNATWQGNIAWLEGGKCQKFRSELEMLKLMMEAVAASRDKDEGELLDTWK